MTLIGNIRSTLSKVASAFADQLIEYRSMNSAPNANPRTYTPWVVLPNARITDVQAMQVYDQDTGIWYYDDKCHLRFPWAADAIKISARTSQIRVGGPSVMPNDLLGRIWSVDAELPQGGESVRVYTLCIRTPLLANTRKGGV